MTIGETAIVGENVTLYQGVTLGGAELEQEMKLLKHGGAVEANVGQQLVSGKTGISDIDSGIESKER